MTGASVSSRFAEAVQNCAQRVEEGPAFAGGRAASVLVVVNMKVLLNDRDGKVLFQNSSYLFREQYQVTSDLNTFFEEDSPAFERLSQDFARTLVSNILEGF